MSRDEYIGDFEQAVQINLSSQFDIPIPSSFAPENKVTLYCGDCLDFLKTMPAESVQLVVTSPPYNIGKEYEDVLDIEVYRAQQRQVIEECARVLKPQGSICWEVGNYINNGEIIPLDILLYDCFRDNGLKLRNRIIWHFGHGLHCKNRFSGRYETINWFTKSDDCNAGSHYTSELIGMAEEYCELYWADYCDFEAIADPGVAYDCRFAIKEATCEEWEAGQWFDDPACQEMVASMECELPEQ